MYKYKRVYIIVPLWRREGTTLKDEMERRDGEER
jgi:hypothetical protein